MRSIDNQIGTLLGKLGAYSLGNQTPEMYLENVFQQTATTVGGLNPVGFIEFYGGNMLGNMDNYAKFRDMYSDRMLLFGYVNPLDGEKALEQIEYQIKNFKVKAFKFYNTDPRGPIRGWKCDDKKVAYPVWEKLLQMGIKVASVHKGLSQGSTYYRYLADPLDIDAAAGDFPELNFFCYHASYPEVEKSAMIAAVHDNFFVDMGPPISSVAARRPEEFDELMTRFLRIAPPKKMTWGTDQILIDGIQDAIEAFWKWQVPRDAQRKWGIKKLTEEDKRAILGQTLGKILGLDMDGILKRTAKDELTKKQAPRVKRFLAQFND
jgi:predicted TIM-barrel fold metal-dependent hydrolase